MYHQSILYMYHLTEVMKIINSSTNCVLLPPLLSVQKIDDGNNKTKTFVCPNCCQFRTEKDLKNILNVVQQVKQQKCQFEPLNSSITVILMKANLKFLHLGKFNVFNQQYPIPRTVLRLYRCFYRSLSEQFGIKQKINSMELAILKLCLSMPSQPTSNLNWSFKVWGHQHWPTNHGPVT